VRAQSERTEEASDEVFDATKALGLGWPGDLAVKQGLIWIIKNWESQSIVATTAQKALEKAWPSH
jgi:hypothetical protein